METIWAAFEMKKILYELREHAAGLNAGRWDYIFSLIKKFRSRPDLALPDRAQVTMAVPFMRAYQQLLVQTSHRREPDITTNALEQVRIDKRRESGDGSDGTWVAHPDLVPVAREVFDAVLGERPDQKEKLPKLIVTAAELLNVDVAGGRITEAGVRTNVSVALQYLA